MTDALPTPGRVRAAQAESAPETTYLNTAAVDLPPRSTAVQEALSAWQAGRAHAPDHDRPVATARAAYAALVGVEPSDVAIGSTVSAFAGPVAAALPHGSEVLTASGEFTSVLFPFLAQAARGMRVREVPLETLPDAVTPATTLVAVSPVQSDVSPAWLSRVGRAPALELLADVGREALHAHAVGLADRFRSAAGLPRGAPRS